MKRLVLVLVATLTFGIGAAGAAEIGHFAPGVLNIRDFAMPAQGFYGVVYNYKYTTERYNDAGGNRVDLITVNPGGGPGTTLDLDVDVDIYALAPTLIWVSPWKVLGANYGAYISPSFSNTSVGAALSTQTGSGRRADGSEFDLCDLFIQPVWLGWAQEHWDIAAGYGFYTPVGRYNTETVTLPVVGDITAEAADNIGFGYWTNQFQGAASWYPWTDKRMAVVNALTWEIHGQKEDFDLTPGQNLSWNWGVSQYLPVSKDQHLLLEIGPAGYSSWQVTDDSGSNARTPAARDDVHGVGVQVGLTHVPWNAALNFRYIGEFASKDRFQGESIGLNLAVKL